MPDRRWRLLTNHAHILVCLDQEPGLRVRDLAAKVGITERAAYDILRDLEQGGYIARTHHGRRSHYEVRRHQPLRHPLHCEHEVGELLAILAERPRPTAEAS